ncbi:SAM-dependent methyltransferase TehB [Pasteurella skyensis]|uniref:SAM-dependent methyltransferase TehB n=1 Tax=Phocoenobacter skyensis TaxID=97481 RepID=A0AAJ6P199_9PAST|nr:SAM-dependent methyltransferase TehB [Pasteurella skyensis]MDP8162696.1 SAM-dependent methyltransferase TehB [Pasteurella skyensis]MDP8173464.1 SAM-dependent methyltransferase TehB [Pasteurella skyensis]MDP8177617.1 SAM-dependent methyltransferase TehB [Pasteurella skyensis]MDP8178798.1 SAM-dependent methyltransferase TehB [Pasteurella skyensis]MDP8183098.1 SAM-dependent methyltransferase TehB [Pasteurella skyensis]
MKDLICYKTMPVWNKKSLPKMFQEKHNTKAGTWGKLTVLKGLLKFYELTEDGEEVSSVILSPDNQADFVTPQLWHKVEAASDDLECQLQFYCKPEDFYAKKYNLTATHSEVLNAANYVPKGKALDLGCGRGRNSLYLNLLGFDVTAVDHNEESISFLNRIIAQEDLSHLQTDIYDINQAAITQKYDFIFSTVVFMFLQADRIPAIISNMQAQTEIGGYNLIVCAMSTEAYPCTQPFSFTFKEGELKAYYQDWELIKYNEDLGKLHRVDEQGNRIQLQFATMLAKKIK